MTMNERRQAGRAGLGFQRILVFLMNLFGLRNMSVSSLPGATPHAFRCAEAIPLPAAITMLPFLLGNSFMPGTPRLRQASGAVAPTVVGYGPQAMHCPGMRRHAIDAINTIKVRVNTPQERKQARENKINRFHHS